MTAEFWMCAVPTLLLAFPLCLGILQALQGCKPWWCYRCKVATERLFGRDELMWLYIHPSGRWDWRLVPAEATCFAWWHIRLWLLALMDSSANGRKLWRVWQ